MSETNEKNAILKSLNYIGLDLENVPNFLMEYKDVDYKPTRAYEQTDYRVYRYINLKDIQILLTPTNRLNSITEKYNKAIPLCEYLDSTNERNLIKKISDNKDEYNNLVDKITLNEIINNLDEKEKKVVLLRFYKEQTQAQVGKILGITQVQVSRIEKRVLEKMRFKLEAVWEKQYV